MILAVCLLLASSVVAVIGPRALARFTASQRWPLASLIAWQVTSWSVVISVVLAASLIAAPALAAAGRLPGGLESCLSAIHHLTNPADSRLLQLVAAAILSALLARLVYCAAVTGAANHRRRARHRVLLSLVAHPDGVLGAHVIADDAAVVYCLPGRGGRVVFTSAALERLTATQLAAVLAHECAHLRGRHHLVVASAGLLALAFPRVRLFAEGWAHTTRLVEMRADDLAARGHGRRSVAEALLALADIASPPAVLAASGVATALRIERLLAPPEPDASPWSSGLARGAISAISIGSLVAAPILLTIAGHAALCLL